MTTFSFYCPACGESMVLDLDTYELAPGREYLQCPNCEQWFAISHEYVPIEQSPTRSRKPWLKPGEALPI